MCTCDAIRCYYLYCELNTVKRNCEASLGRYHLYCALNTVLFLLEQSTFMQRSAGHA